MTPDAANALRALAIGLGVVASIGVGVALIRAAKRGGPGVQMLGAMMMLAFSWATIRDPYKDAIKEVRDDRRRGEAGGDPPDPV